MQVGDTIDVVFQGTAWYGEGKIIDLQDQDVVAEFNGEHSGFIVKAPQSQVNNLGRGWQLVL